MAPRAFRFNSMIIGQLGVRPLLQRYIATRLRDLSTQNRVDRAVLTAEKTNQPTKEHTIQQKQTNQHKA